MNAIKQYVIEIDKDKLFCELSDVRTRKEV